MSAGFLEVQRRKEAPILRFGTEEGWGYERANSLDDAPTHAYGLGKVKWYSDARYRDDERMKTLFSYVVTAYREFLEGRLAAPEFLDETLFAKTHARCLIWNSYHALTDANSRYYLKPYTLRLEPIATDQVMYTALASDRGDCQCTTLAAGSIRSVSS